jgi:hypothetical protein
MDDIMNLLQTGRVKLPNGYRIEAREDDDDDPYGIG